MKIKKIMLGALAAATMATSLGVASTPVFAAEETQTSTYSTYQSLSDVVPFPDVSLKEETSFDHNGITYALDTSTDTYYALAVSNPTNIRYLVMYSHLFDKEINYSNFDLSNYVNVIRVVINANNPTDYYQYLSSLTKEFDLYLTGQFMFNEHITDLNIKNLYSTCAYFANSEALDSISHLQGSNIDAVYNYRFGNNFWAYYTTDFDEAGITNADGTALTMNVITASSASDLKFDLEVFYPHDGYKTTVPYLGASGYNEVEDLTNDGLIQDKIGHYVRTIDDKVETLYFDYEGFDAGNVMFSCNRLVLPHYDGQSFLNSDFEELVLINNYDNYNFTYFQGAKTIRFVSPESGGGVVWNGFGKNVNYIANIEKILIPIQYAESHYSMLVNDEDLGPKVETYDESTYTMPTRSSFLSDNGNIYEVEDQSITLTELEADIAVMTEEGVTPTTDTPVDVQIAAYYASLPEVDDTTDSGSTDDDGNEDGEIEFADESEFTTGLHTIGSLIYSSDRNLEEILKIVGNFAVWNDGELGDPSDYHIVLTETLGRLGVTVYDSENTIVKSVSFGIKQVNGAYGEFIYTELFGTTRGVLLVDIDSTRSTDINELYDYVLANAINASFIDETNVENFTFSEANIANVESYYTHAVAGTNFIIDTQVICQDYELLNDMENVEVTITKVINPDDDIEDAESEYSIKHIEKIYVPGSINGPMIPHCIKDMLLYKKNELSNESITVTYSHNGNINTEDYTFICYITLPDGVRYIHEIEVELLNSAYQVGYCLFDDGTLAAITPYQSGISVDTFKYAIEDFIKTTLNITTPNVTFAENILEDTSLNTASTYDNGKQLVTLNCGIAALAYSTPDRPVDNSNLKQGYNAMTNIYFTSNYNVNDVVKAIGNKILLKEGVQVETEYTVKSTVYEDTIHWEFYIDETKVYSCQTSYHIIKDSTVGNYIYAEAIEFHTGLLLLEVGNTNDFNDIYTEVIDVCQNAMETPTTDTTLDLSKENETVIREIHMLGDFNYYNVETTVNVIDIESEVEDSTTEIITPTPTPDQGGTQTPDNDDETPDDGKLDEIKDKVNDWFEDFKAKLEENKALKAATIALGTITGILLIYGIYVIFKKLFRWLGR